MKHSGRTHDGALLLLVARFGQPGDAIIPDGQLKGRRSTISAGFPTQRLPSRGCGERSPSTATGRPTSSWRCSASPASTFRRAPSQAAAVARANTPTTKRHARANGKSEIATTWQLFLNGHGWDES